MNTRNTIRTLMMIGIATAWFAVPAIADPALQPVHVPNATYITGGIGADEQQALKAAAAKDYNLEIINTDPDGHYTAGTTVQITSKDGHTTICVKDTGPLFYAKLQPGEYAIRVTNSTQQEVRNVKVSGQKQTDVRLVWKQD